MILFKFVIMVFYNFAFKIAKRQTNNPKAGVKLRFSLLLSSFLLFLVFIFLNMCIKIFNLKISFLIEGILNYCLAFILIVSFSLFFLIDFNSIKEIKLTSYEKNKSLLILVLFAFSTILFFTLN